MLLVLERPDRREEACEAGTQLNGRLIVCCSRQGGWRRPQCSNGTPILPAGGLCFRRQSRSWCRPDVFSSTSSTNGGHTFRRRTPQRCREMYGGPYVRRLHPTRRLGDNLWRWRFELPINKLQR